jgi:urate oxidase
MSAVLTQNSYGKSHVRLTRVTRHGDRHDLKELSVAVRLEGDFAASYIAGDNRRVVATDTMKNTVYVLANQHGVVNPETFGQALARHFLQEYSQVARATIELQEHPWQRIVAGGREHPHAFIGGGSERRTCTVNASREGVSIESGLDGLLVLKTTESAFAGFVRDRYTTLPETNDRIFATAVAATWTCDPTPADWDACHQHVRQTLLDVFANHQSLGVQHTLYAMGEAALAATPELQEIRLRMPNKHRILVNLQPLGFNNENEVFVTTDEPFGLISGTVRRGG